MPDIKQLVCTQHIVFEIMVFVTRPGIEEVDLHIDAAIQGLLYQPLTASDPFQIPG